MSALRRRALPLAALALGLLGLVLTLVGSASPPRVAVVLATHALAPGRSVAPSALRLVEVDARDVTPTMLRAISEAAYRRPLVAVPAGDYLTSSVLARAGGGEAPLAAGQRAVSLRLEPSASPPASLLTAGARVDVVVSADADPTHPARSVVVASGLALLGPARAVDGSLVVTLRASLHQAVALTAAQSYAHDLRLLLRGPGDNAGRPGMTVDATDLGGHP